MGRAGSWRALLGPCWLVTGTAVSSQLVAEPDLVELAWGGHCWDVSACAGQCWFVVARGGHCLGNAGSWRALLGPWRLVAGTAGSIKLSAETALVALARGGHCWDVSVCAGHCWFVLARGGHCLGNAGSWRALLGLCWLVAGTAASSQLVVETALVELASSGQCWVVPSRGGHCCFVPARGGHCLGTAGSWQALLGPYRLVVGTAASSQRVVETALVEFARSGQCWVVPSCVGHCWIELARGGRCWVVFFVAGTARVALALDEQCWFVLTCSGRCSVVAGTAGVVLARCRHYRVTLGCGAHCWVMLWRGGHCCGWNGSWWTQLGRVSSWWALLGSWWPKADTAGWCWLVAGTGVACWPPAGIAVVILARGHYRSLAGSWQALLGRVSLCWALLGCAG